ncbi:MAG: hypothetical protein JSU94_00105, partial [Phycisphaerales bacterium]
MPTKCSVSDRCDFEMSRGVICPAKGTLWTRLILLPAAICGVLLCFVCGCTVAPQTGGIPQQHDRALALLSIEPVARPDYDGYADANEWWDDLISALNMEFWRLCWSEDNEEYLTRLIHEFGKHGPLVDMKLCIADSSVMFAQEYEQPAKPYLSARRPEHRVLGSKYRQIQNLVSKIQVEFFLRNPDAVERYYNVLIWSRQFLGAQEGEWWPFLSKVRGLAEFFTSSPEGDPDYWWYAREFMLLAHATGRDDLLGDVEAAGLYSRYEKWSQWLWTNISEKAGWTRLFPNPEKPIWVERDSVLASGRVLLKRPAVPFADWYSDGLPAPPPLHLIDYLLSPASEYFADRIPWPRDYILCGTSAGP